MKIISDRAQNISSSPTLAISAKAKKMKAEGKDVIGFGAGEPDFDTPVHIKQAAVKSINDGFTKYTAESGTDELKDAITGKFKRDNGLVYERAQVIVGCGAKHVLYNIFLAICDPGDEVIVFSPYWVSYTEMIRLADAVPVIVDTFEKDAFVPSAESLKKALTKRTKIIIINSPNNPTGAVYPENTLREIADIAVKNNIIVISDEVYESMIYGNSRHVSIASFNNEIYSNTITVNAVSKTYAMTGWRIGYAAGPKEIISAMSKIQSHSTSNPTSISQKAAVCALNSSQEETIKMTKEFAKRRDFIIERCRKIKGVTFAPPQGAFYLFINIFCIYGKKPGINNSLEFSDKLLNEEHVAVVPGSAFGADNYMRVTFANSLKEIEEGFNRIQRFMEK